MPLVLRTRLPRYGLAAIFSRPERYMRMLLPGSELRGGRVPRFTVEQAEERIVFRAELPRHAAADLDISAMKESLTISGSHSYTDAAAESGSRADVREAGFFSRSFPLPGNADWEKTRADLDEQVLTVTVPLAGAEAPRRIEVTTP